VSVYNDREAVSWDKLQAVAANTSAGDKFLHLRLKDEPTKSPTRFLPSARIRPNSSAASPVGRRASLLTSIVSTSPQPFLVSSLTTHSMTTSVRRRCNYSPSTAAQTRSFSLPGLHPDPGVDLVEILCVEEERQVGQDNRVSYRTLKLQIPESPMRPHFVKARVKVHVYPDGSHALFHAPRCIGRYDEKGGLRTTDDARRAA
jgi:hypothetical protein